MHHEPDIMILYQQEGGTVIRHVILDLSLIKPGVKGMN